MHNLKLSKFRQTLDVSDVSMPIIRRYNRSALSAVLFGKDNSQSSKKE